MRFQLLTALIFCLVWIEYPLGVSGYRPVILMHGLQVLPLGRLGSGLDTLEAYIKAAHPGTEVHKVNAYNGEESLFTNMSTQVKGVWEIIKPIIQDAPDGANMICYSQGGITCRAILGQHPVTVKSFISLSSPQAGQFGVTQFDKFFPNTTRDNAYRTFYTTSGQNRFSIANYWNDPHQQQLYYDYNKFLPLLLNNASETFRSNFLRLQQLTMIGGPDDGVITPWQSSHFGYYDYNMAVVPYTSQKFYVDDSFGLRTLDREGRLKIITVPGVEHLNWPSDKTVFEKYIEPYLQ